MPEDSRKLPVWFPNVNALWGSLLAETLVQLGLRHAVISPGSRSTPLTCALATHPGIESIPVLDERSAAFFALGLAKRHGRPALLLCTSGSAGAHYFPAIIEARESNVPLLVITADRPPELRNCASGQTIDQLKLYGNYPVFQTELALPDGSIPLLHYLRQTLVHAYSKSLQPIPGPVHLNAPFRDPLAPSKVGEGIALDLATVVPVKERNGPCDCDGQTVSINRVDQGFSRFLSNCVTGRTLIVVGPQSVSNTAAFCHNVQRLANHLKAPVLADALGALRSSQKVSDGVITTYDLILRNPVIADSLKPDCVIQIGPLPTSKLLRECLAKWQLPTFLIHPAGEYLDPCHAHTTLVTMDLSAGEWVIPESRIPASGENPTYGREWASVDVTASNLLLKALEQREAEAGIFEGAVMRHLAVTLPECALLFIANSMPVRDAEYFWPKTSRDHQLFFNRGANGIDGTLSTALGLAASGDTVYLITGDLAFLHDTNGLLSAHQIKGRVIVILINNDGGGIFGHLPIAEHEEVFERFFATPQTISFAALAKAYDCGYTKVETMAEFKTALASDSSLKLRIIEVPTDRKADAQWRKQQFRKLSEALV